VYKVFLNIKTIHIPRQLTRLALFLSRKKTSQRSNTGARSAAAAAAAGFYIANAESQLNSQKRGKTDSFYNSLSIITARYTLTLEIYREEESEWIFPDCQSAYNDQ